MFRLYSRRKKEEGRSKKEEGRRKKEEVITAAPVMFTAKRNIWHGSKMLPLFS
ncbi:MULTISPECIES: hypothetical protein [Okeania]|uniref:hypothetical protein n=1 Tax=Okeania TaxID=1458928 RepID=UPI001374D501|nr:MULTISPECIES: hypothetical protein [Okeania]NET22893.1 hypothetical protein [Okeania sp. SIO1H5]NET75588.1 hypothetical protein [Okeania sp. SIO1F9]NET92957.1 hypothetical protein [Okeania sp. SIO1H2]